MNLAHRIPERLSAHWRPKHWIPAFAGMSGFQEWRMKKGRTR